MQIPRRFLWSIVAVLGITLGIWPAQAQSIYRGALAADWKNYSWGCTTDFNSTTYINKGTNSIQVTYTAPLQGLMLHHKPFHSSPYTTPFPLQEYLN